MTDPNAIIDRVSRANDAVDDLRSAGVLYLKTKSYALRIGPATPRKRRPGDPPDLPNPMLQMEMPMCACGHDMPAQHTPEGICMYCVDPTKCRAPEPSDPEDGD